MQHRHTHLLVYVALLLGIGSVGYAVTKTSPAAAPPAAMDTGDATIASAAGCSSSFLQHTYNPARLLSLKPCIKATGTVEVIRHEKDGDWHVLLRLDKGQSGLLNDGNLRLQKGDLVVEPQCVGAVVQPDAIAPCQGATPPAGIQLIKIGAHITVTGPWVNDLQHGWLEIHGPSVITSAGG